MNPDEIIQTRAQTHGRYEDTSKIAQNLKRCCDGLANRLEPHQRESLEMICVKMARILNGDASNPDHWDDIAGYAGLGKDPGR